MPTTTRLDLEGRLAAITARISTRNGEIDAIEARQLAAATAGEDPDPALVTAKAALSDATSIDERATAALRGQIDQMLSAEQHAQDVAELKRLRREVAAKVATASAAADAWPDLWQAAHDAVTVALRGLVDAHAEVVRLDREAEAVAGTAAQLAAQLGEDAPVVTAQQEKLEQVVISYPAWVGWNDLTMASGRLFAAVKAGDVREAARQLGLAAYPPSHIPKPTHAQVSNPFQQQLLDAEYQQHMQVHDRLMQRLGRQG